MSIKKEYLNDYRKCRVTFIIPRRIGKNAEKAQVVGEFNRWTHSATPMKKLNNGTFVAIMEFPIGKEYQFRYLLDNKVWMNDSDADKFVPTPFGDSENCVLSTYNDSHIEMIKVNQLQARSATFNVQPLVESFPDKSSPAKSLFSMLKGQLKTIIRIFTKPSLALKT